MYQLHKTRQCQCCLSDLDLSISLFNLFYQPNVCSACLNKFEVIESDFIFNGFCMLVLYDYNSFFQKLLFQYKGYYDVALAPVFLTIFKNDILDKYSGYTFVVLPSSKEDDEIRGFNPNIEIIKSLGLDIFNGLYKNIKYKQTSSNDRNKIADVLKIKDGHLLKGKKVVIFDDVITSGSTLNAAMALILQLDVLELEIIVMACKQETCNNLLIQQYNTN